ncbi:MAG: AraC family transcriptional regulator [Planctomycetes bacterium]|nr:AraC family transcriptional regulator [Planctomycetota bacterium]
MAKTIDDYLHELPALVCRLKPNLLLYDRERRARRLKYPPARWAHPPKDFPPAHRHPHLELCIALSGRCPFLLGERRHTLRRGHVVVLSPEAFHCELAADRCGPYRLLWVSCHPTEAHLFVQDHLGRRIFNQDAPRVNLKKFAEAYQSVREIDYELWAAQLGAFRRVQGLLLGLCGLFERAVGAAARARPPARDEAVQRRRVERAVEYVRDHFSEPLDLQEVAVHVGVSAGYLSALFTRTLGRSFTDYLASCRLEEAERLLAQPSLSVKEVAVRVGIQNPLYFSRLFRKHTGFSPSQFRNAK